VSRVLIGEAVHASLSPLAGLDVDEQVGIWRDRRRLLEAVRECEALIVRNQTMVDAELVRAALSLRVVGRLGAGLDNLDLDALRERSIAVVHAGGLNAHAVAEYVLGACLALARGIAASDREVRRGGWTRRIGLEIRGQTLGVIGLGATGAETARLAMAVGMRVLGHDPFTEPPAGVEQLALADLLSRSRFVSVHVALNDSTRGLLSAGALAVLPRGAYVINTARGGVIDEQALLFALESGHLGGAALDVRAQEPPGPDDALAQRDDVLVTAHIAGLTIESQRGIAEHVLGGVRRALTP